MAQLLDQSLIDEIKNIQKITGKPDLLAGFVRKLEGDLAGFSAAFATCVARGDDAGAVRTAHTLKGACHQLGLPALGDLFAQIEHSAKAGDYAEAKRLFEGSASVVAQSLEALKRA